MSTSHQSILLKEDTVMDHIRRIVLCGDSVFLLAIESSLATLPQVETIRINPHIPDVLARIAAQEADLIILEKGTNNGKIPLALLQGSIPLIIMDSDKHNLTIVTGTQVQVAEFSDLLQVIDQQVPPAY